MCLRERQCALRTDNVFSRETICLRERQCVFGKQCLLGRDSVYGTKKKRNIKQVITRAPGLRLTLKEGRWIELFKPDSPAAAKTKNKNMSRSPVHWHAEMNVLLKHRGATKENAQREASIATSKVMRRFEEAIAAL